MLARSCFSRVFPLFRLLVKSRRPGPIFLRPFASSSAQEGGGDDHDEYFSSLSNELEDSVAYTHDQLMSALEVFKRRHSRPTILANSSATAAQGPSLSASFLKLFQRSNSADCPIDSSDCSRIERLLCCGDLSGALEIFHSTAEPLSPAVWNGILLANSIRTSESASENSPRAVFDISSFFSRMRSSGFSGDSTTFKLAMDFGTDAKDFDKILQFYQESCDFGIDLNIFCYNAVLNAYMNLDLWKEFRCFQLRIATATVREEEIENMQIFQESQETFELASLESVLAISPSSASFVIGSPHFNSETYRLCIEMFDRQQGTRPLVVEFYKELAGRFPSSLNVLIYSTVIHSLALLVDLGSAVAVYQEMQGLGIIPTLTILSNLIYCANRAGDSATLHRLLSDIHRYDLQPNMGILQLLLASFAKHGDKAKVLRIWELIQMNFLSRRKNEPKNRRLTEVRNAARPWKDRPPVDPLDILQTQGEQKENPGTGPRTHKDLSGREDSWILRSCYNSLILCFGLSGDLAAVLGFVNEMRAKKLQPNAATLESLLVCYGRAGKCKQLVKVYHQLLAIPGYRASLELFVEVFRGLSKFPDYWPFVDLVRNHHMKAAGVEPNLIIYYQLISDAERCASTGNPSRRIETLFDEMVSNPAIQSLVSQNSFEAQTGGPGFGQENEEFLAEELMNRFLAPNVSSTRGFHRRLLSSIVKIRFRHYSRHRGFYFDSLVQFLHKFIFANGSGIERMHYFSVRKYPNTLNTKLIFPIEDSMIALVCSVLLSHATFQPINHLFNQLHAVYKRHESRSAQPVALVDDWRVSHSLFGREFFYSLSIHAFNDLLKEVLQLSSKSREGSAPLHSHHYFTQLLSHPYVTEVLRPRFNSSTYLLILSYYNRFRQWDRLELLSQDLVHKQPAQILDNSVMSFFVSQMHKNPAFRRNLSFSAAFYLILWKSISSSHEHRRLSLYQAFFLNLAGFLDNGTIKAENFALPSVIRNPQGHLNFNSPADPRYFVPSFFNKFRVEFLFDERPLEIIKFGIVTTGNNETGLMKAMRNCPFTCKLIIVLIEKLQLDQIVEFDEFRSVLLDFLASSRNFLKRDDPRLGDFSLHGSNDELADQRWNFETPDETANELIDRIRENKEFETENLKL